jgi:hypothetical protein
VRSRRRLRPSRGELPFGFGLHHLRKVGHRHRPNRIHSRCRPAIHLQLLSTPPHGDAVSIGFRPEGSGPGGLAPPDDAPLQAHRSRCAAAW